MVWIYCTTTATHTAVPWLDVQPKGNKLNSDVVDMFRIEDGKIFINGEETNEYTFKMDYYWMMGDNRHDSLDARFWGFVPEDHIVGKPKIIWLSLDKDKKFLAKIRWDRMFMRIR